MNVSQSWLVLFFVFLRFYLLFRKLAQDLFFFVRVLAQGFTLFVKVVALVNLIVVDWLIIIIVIIIIAVLIVIVACIVYVVVVCEVGIIAITVVGLIAVFGVVLLVRGLLLWLIFESSRRCFKKILILHRILTILIVVAAIVSLWGWR